MQRHRVRQAFIYVSEQLVNNIYELKIMVFNATFNNIILVKLKSSLRKAYGRRHDLGDCYGISVSQMTEVV